MGIFVIVKDWGALQDLKKEREWRGTQAKS
jgi:hypothetical protein